MTSIITTSFDYSTISDPKVADIVRNTAEEIRALDRGIVHNVISIGRHLQAVKEQLPHGQFGDWLRAEFDLTPSTAYNYMAVAARFGENSNGVGNLPLRTVYALAPAGVPDEAIDEARTLAADGITVTPEIARGIRDDVQQPAPEIADPADPSTDSDLDTVLAAFATGIPIKSLHMIKHLTGIQDEVRLLSALNLLVVTGELRAAGQTTYQRVDPAPATTPTPDPVPAAGPAAGLDEIAIGELGSKIYNWLKEQSEPQGTLAIGSAVGAYYTATKAATEHMVSLGWIEVERQKYNTKYYRAITLEDHRERNPDPWKPSEGDQVPAEPTQESIEPPRDIMLHITDAVREALAKWRTLPVYEPGFSVTLGWLAQETGYERDELIAACNLLVGEGTLWADPDDYGVCFLLEAPAVEDDPAPVQASAQETPAESPEALPGESDNNAEPSGDVQMLLNAAVRALRNHGAGMFYHELKQFMAGDNQRTNQALAFGVKSGVLVKDDRNYYTLPEFATRAKTEPIPPAPDSAKARLIMLVEAAKKAQQFAQDLEKFTAQDSWNDLDLDTLNEARSTISRAAGILSRSGKHLSEMYRPLSVAISHQESVYEGINGD